MDRRRHRPKDIYHRVNKMDLHPPIRKYMGLLSNIVKDSVNKVRRGQYDGNFGEGYSTQHAKSYVVPKFPLFLFGLYNSL